MCAALRSRAPAACDRPLAAAGRRAIQSPLPSGRRDLRCAIAERAAARRRARASLGDEPAASVDHPPPPALFIFGMGYTGRELARQAAARGWRVCGTSTTGGDESADARAAAAAGRPPPPPPAHPIEVVRFAPRRDGSDRARGAGAEAEAALLLGPAGRAALAAATHVLVSVPPVASPMYDPVLAAQLALLRWRALLPLTPPMAAASGGAALPPPPPRPSADSTGRRKEEEEEDDDKAALPSSTLPPPPPPLRWVGYLSSTGVYGDRGGGWVDESDAPAPSSARGVVRLEHERAWEGALARVAGEMAERVAGGPAPPLSPPALRVFRLGGIYGPGRSVLEPLLAELGGGGRPAGARAAVRGGGRVGGTAGEEQGGASRPAPSSSPQRARRRRQRFTSRVHVADAARAALASAAAAAAPYSASGGGGGGGGGVIAGDGFPPLPARVYNVVDDLPAPRSEVEAYALSRLRAAGVQVARAAPADDDEGAGNDGAAAVAAAAAAPAAAAEAPPLPPLEEKRVRNARLKTELLIGESRSLLYPDYRPAIDELVASICNG